MAVFKFIGTCCREVDLEVASGIILTVNFKGGCPGNLLGLKNLLEGRRIADVLGMLEGVPCGTKSTSCPDQLAKVLKAHF